MSIRKALAELATMFREYQPAPVVTLTEAGEP